MTAAAAPASGRRWPARADVLGVAFLALVFVVAVWGRLDQPLGRSHDGFNTAVWMDGGRALVEDGITTSRLGARVDGAEPYAHHPPGLYVIAAVAHAVGGTRPFVAHLPGVVSVIAGLGLGWALLRELGRSRVACFVALSLAVGAPMLLLYGPMLNHESIALPWALAALHIVARAHHGRVAPWWVAALLGFGGAVLTWQGTLLLGLLLLSLVAARVVPSWRLDAAARRTVLALGGGAALAVVCTVAWQIWVYGDLGNVVDAVLFRVDGEEATEDGFVVSQVRYLAQGFPLWTLAITGYGLLLVWRDRVSALVAGALVASVAGYTLAFRQGARVHSYWNFWAVMVVLLAAAAVVDRHLGHLRRVRRGPEALVAACAVLVVLTSAVLDVRGVREVEMGTRAGEVVTRTRLSPDQATFFTMTDWEEEQPWVTYAVRRPSVRLSGVDDVRAREATEPDAVVLVRRETIDAVREGAFAALGGRFLEARDPYATVTVRELVRALR